MVEGNMMKAGTETRSLMNHIFSCAGEPEPQIGMGATVLGWTDMAWHLLRREQKNGTKVPLTKTRIERRIETMKRIYFGIGQGFDKDGHSIAYSLPERKQKAFHLIAEAFGGFHAQEGNGGWIDPRGKLILEPSLGITVFTSNGDADIQFTAMELARIFNQESVLVAIEPVTSLEFIHSSGASGVIFKGE